MGRPGILWFVLDQPSSERLRLAIPPLYPNTFYHHVTLRYAVEKTEVEQFIDKSWTVEAYAVASDGKVQACRVRTEGLPDEYGAPHVTLSTAMGVKPFASVAMLQAHPTETPLDLPLQLTGTVQFEHLDQVKD